MIMGVYLDFRESVYRLPLRQFWSLDEVNTSF
jgi:hypothetical protein